MAKRTLPDGSTRTKLCRPCLVTAMRMAASGLSSGVWDEASLRATPRTTCDVCTKPAKHELTLRAPTRV